MKTCITVCSVMACIVLFVFLSGMTVAAQEMQEGGNMVEEAGGTGMETYDQPGDSPVPGGDYDMQGGELIPGEEGQMREGGDAAGEWEAVPPAPGDERYYHEQEQPLQDEAGAVEGQEYMNPDANQDVEMGSQGREMAPEEFQGEMQEESSRGQ